MQTTWLTSMEVFAPLTLPVLELVQPKRIGEIGAAEGGNTRILFEFMKKMSGHLVTIDPSPRGTFLSWVQSAGGVVQHIAEKSLDCIAKAGAVDVWFVDGDHNWYTVFNELIQIDLAAKQFRKQTLIFMHDVGWPCARRDMYYDPSNVPPEFVKPNSNQLGLTFANHASPRGALKGPYWALEEGGPRNGVLTAIEDFMRASTTQFSWFYVPAILGLGVLVDKQHVHYQAIADFFAPYHNNPVMALVEKDRISQFLQVTEMNERLKEISALVKD